MVSRAGGWPVHGGVLPRGALLWQRSMVNTTRTTFLRGPPGRRQIDKGKGPDDWRGHKTAMVSHAGDDRAVVEALQSIEKEEEVEFQGEAVAAWVGAAVAFGAGVWYFLGVEKAEEYFAGYLMEQSLSLDNLFVFILVFNYFQTPTECQPKVLSYGIASAAMLRLVMVGLGVELIESFKPVFLGFALLLLYSSFKLIAEGDDDEEDLEENGVVKFCKGAMRVSDEYDGDNFFTVEDGVRVATPLLLALAVVEISDVVFAVDSIPAVFGVTLDPFIVYTSNMFAILSLRSLYGFVSVIMTRLKFLDKAVALVLGFIGTKMIADFSGYHISTELSLLVVGCLLGGGVATSLWLPEPTDAA
ncbi:unnamed protein product [Ostreobium quekettii]|uniref:Integral membrane protein TerC n=1 Tax=Ostreobium quekettii TaxID=121088 RepID=A0A8S1J449_9CHLO|nr:unnamed protein product [Ostreobium quekettii]|eukprot:evm.model.scf_398.12 EVM.evm.TU.scf_398.12   scf_398:70109-73335(-)